MGTETAELTAVSRPAHPAVTLGLLAALALLAHFVLAGSYGLYSDDYFFVGRAMALDGAGVGDWLMQVLRHWPQGRPVGFGLSVLIAWAAYAIGGLLAVYAAGYAIVVLNGWLLYRLVARLFDPHLALLSGAFFILLPADTTRQLLTHNLILQPSLTFALLGLLLYTRPEGRRGAAFAVASLSLLTYESAFLLFVMAPLFGRQPWPAMRRRLPAHWLICGLLMAAALAVRLAYGESRVTALPQTGMAIPLRILAGFAIGPWTAISQSTVGFMLDLARLGPAEGWIVPAVALAAFVPAIVLLAVHHRRSPPAAAPIRRALVAGLALLPVAYALSFTHYPPDARHGGGTSVHLAATVPAAMVLAAACLLLANSRWRALRAGARGLIALLIVAMTGYGVVVQRGYIRTFEDQRTFWSQVLAACPDMDEQSVIIAMGSRPSRSYFAQPAAAETPLVPRLLFQWPGELLPLPREPIRPTLLLVNDAAALADFLGEDEQGLYWARSPNWTVFPGDRLPAEPIVLEVDPRSVRRIEGQVTAGAFSINARPINPNVGLKAQLPPALPLYNHLIDWTFLVDADPFSGFTAAESLSPPAGPFPEHRLPRVRSATTAEMAIHFTARPGAQGVLVFEATSVLPDQRLDIHLNGQRLARVDLPQWTFRRFSVPLPAQPGENTVRITCSAVDPTRAKLVHFSKLQVLWSDQP